MTVLLVEDNLMFRQSFKESLLAYRPELPIVEASEGLQALKLVQEYCPQVIFMDMQLPGESGIELTHTIHKLFPRTKIIIFTINSPESEYLEAAAAAGASHFIPKGSWSMEEIMTLIG